MRNRDEFEKELAELIGYKRPADGCGDKFTMYDRSCMLEEVEKLVEVEPDKDRTLERLATALNRRAKHGCSDRYLRPDVPVLRIENGKPEELFDFAKRIGHSLVAQERLSVFPDGPCAYYARFEDAMVTKGEDLSFAEWGGADTVDGALKDYAKTISGKRLTFPNHDGTGYWVWAPVLVHTRKTSASVPPPPGKAS